LTRIIRDIAFSGDGEPTMLHNFDEVVEAVAEVKREARLEDTKIVLITDAAGLDKASVRRGLEIMDANNGEVWAKLDAGTKEYFRQVNRTSVKFQRILDNLCATAKARPILIQSLFLNIYGESMSRQELETYCGRLNDITAAGGQIREVQAYTVARPAPETFASRLTKEELGELAKVIHESTGLKVEIYD
jgi:wyosine [tRNA(Phe)-imidazoG37] synthetase (radical SAM superfamily)